MMKKDTNRVFRFHEVNEHDLVSDWRSQTGAYWQFAQEVADLELELDRAKTRVDVLKDELKLVEAELSLGIRADPAKYELEKVTEPTIEACILCRPRYKKALQTLREAEEEVNVKKHAFGIAKARIHTMDQKKATLENITRLRLGAYYSDPKLPSDNNVSNYAARRAVQGGKKRKETE